MHLLSRCVKFEPRLFQNRTEGNVRPREFVSNLIENSQRVRSPKSKISLLYPTDDIGSSLDVSPVEHVVPLPFRKEVLDFHGRSVGSPRPCDGKIFSDSRNDPIPIAEELVVHDERPWATARMLLGFERVS